MYNPREIAEPQYISLFKISRERFNIKPSRLDSSILEMPNLPHFILKQSAVGKDCILLLFDTFWASIVSSNKQRIDIIQHTLSTKMQSTPRNKGCIYTGNGND